MKKRWLILGLFATISVAFGVYSVDTFAAVPSVKDGQRLCGTFTYEVPGHSVGKQDFQICGIVDGKGKFKSSMGLRNDNWNNSIVYVEANSNIINVYDSPTNNNWGVGGRPGCVNFLGCSGRQQFKAEVGQSFSDTLYGVRNYLDGLKDRMYWPGGSAGSYTANLKYEIDWSVEDVSADDTTQVANNKAKCEANGGTWSGDDASGYTCSNDESLNTAPSSSPTASSSDHDACYSNADAWGWVLCTALKSAGGAIESLYQSFIVPELNLEPQLFSQDNGTFDAWEIFRNFANIAFIIFFVIVILSQLTGFGIDNYGIKKSLPRLILMAIMINLSFIICQLAIDISNILGVSIQGLFDWISGNVSGDINGADMGSALGASLAVVTGLGVGAGVAVALAGWALVVPALLAVLSGLLSIIFLFFILGVRKAAVVLLVALAPLALACYILPNTKPWFDRWLKIFKTLLFVYPICGLLIGAGHLAGIMLLAVSNDFLMNVIAVIVYLGPVFAIPAVLRSAIASADNVFGNLVNRGRGLTGNIQNAAGGAMRNSSRYQDYTKQRRAQRSLNYSNRVAGRLSDRNNLSAAQQRQLAYHRRNISAAEREQMEGITAGWQDADGNFDLNAVKQAALTSGDRLTQRAALDAWGDAKPDQIAEAIRDGQLNSGALAYIRSNGKLAAAVGTQDGRVKEFLKTNGSNYHTWASQGAFDANGQATTNEVLAVQNMSASALAAQDHSVLASQAEHSMLSGAQLQSFADNPNLVGGLQSDVRQHLDSQLPESTQVKAQNEAKSQAQESLEATNKLRQEMATGVSTYEVTHPNGVTVQIRGRKMGNGTILTETGQRFDPLHHNIQHKG